MNKTMKVEGPLHVVCQCDKCKAQPEQEPVEVCCGDYHKCSKPCTPRGRYYGEKLAPKRPWVGLTDEDIAYAYTLEKKFAMQYVDAKLKELNT